MSLSAKHKLNILITIICIITIVFCIGSIFYAPFTGFQGFLFTILRQVIVIVAAAIIITAIIKYKSVCKTDKIAKYIFVGVLLYGILVAFIAKIAYNTFCDYKDKPVELTVESADYDTYYKTYNKLGKLHYLNVNMDGKLNVFLIDEESYQTAKQQDTLVITYYANTNVIESIN